MIMEFELETEHWKSLNYWNIAILNDIFNYCYFLQGINIKKEKTGPKIYSSPVFVFFNEIF